MNGAWKISQTDGCEAPEASIRRRGSSSAANQVLPQRNEESGYRAGRRPIGTSDSDGLRARLGQKTQTNDVEAYMCVLGGVIEMFDRFK